MTGNLFFSILTTWSDLWRFYYLYKCYSLQS